MLNDPRDVYRPDPGNGGSSLQGLIRSAVCKGVYDFDMRRRTETTKTSMFYGAV